MCTTNKQLSIIIPVYNVEMFIRPCFESIFRQGLPEEAYEIIVVDDGTPDRSMERITDLLNQHHNITVISQKNQGLSMARNNGFDKATGDYVLFLDSDDLLVDGVLPLLLKKSLDSKADMVIADFTNLKSGDLIPDPIDLSQENIEWEEKTGREMFLVLDNLYKATVWHALYKREFLQAHHILFEPGIYYEDVPFTHECYLKAGKCLMTNLPIVHHLCDREGAITSHFTMKHAESLAKSIGKTWNLKNTEHLSLEEFQMLQRSVFIRFYRIITWSVSHLGGSERRQAMRKLVQEAPDLTFSESTLQKVITRIYKVSPSLLISLWAIKMKCFPHEGGY